MHDKLKFSFKALTTIAILSGAAYPAQATPEPAQRSDDLVDHIGMATHWGYTDTPYGFAYDKVKTLLGESGIRHIRDGFHPREVDLYQAYGIKSTVIFGPGAQPPGEQIKVLQDHIPLVDMIEGPNEVDIFPTSSNYKSQTFPAGAIAYQNDLYAAVKGNPAMSHIGVIAPSTARMDSNLKLAPLNSFDYLVMHSYAGGAKPSNSLEGGIVSNLLNASRIQGSSAILKPIVVTESGYHTALRNDNTLGGAQPGVSEAAQAKYMPRHFAEYFNAGIVRTITYEFIDEFPNEDTNPEASFGVVHRDLSPKPAYTALKNLISLLKEAAWNKEQARWQKPTWQQQALDYSLVGDIRNIHHTLLQKGDGTFYLLVWQEISSFDTQQKQDINNPAVPVTLNFATPLQAATIYLPRQSTQPLNSWTNPQQLQLNVPDEVLVVELKPRPQRNAPVPAAPTTINATATGNSVTLAWPALAGRNKGQSKVAGYFVSRLGRYLGTATGTSFTDTHLSPATGYTYTVQSYDTTGRVSPPLTKVVMTPAQFPDLIVTALSWTPANPKVGEAITFHATIKNIGNGASPSGVTHGVSFQVDRANVNWSDTLQEALAPGATRTLIANNGAKGNSTWIATPGTHTVVAYVDDVNRINESNENNNQLQQPLTVGQ